MKKSIFVGVAACALIPSSAWAQSTADGQRVGVEEIIVTAQKREERLQDVPIAITAIGGESLQRQNVQSVVDIGRLSVPGLTTSQQTGSPIIGLAMRGIASQDQQAATLEPGVALYIDGIYIPRTQGLMGDLVEVERIEVLRGPQGTLFGRNAEGGAISVVSKGPTGEFGGSIGAEVGKFGNRRGYIHLNLPKLDTVSVKIDGYREHFGGFTKNAPQLAGQDLDAHFDFGRRRNWGVRGQVLWEPSDEFSALVTVDHSRLKNAPIYTSFDVTPRDFFGNALPPFRADPSYVKQTAIPLYNDYYRDAVDGQSLVLTYDVSDNVSLKSITARRKLDSSGGNNLVFFSSFPIDGAGNQLSGILAQGLVTSKTFSQEFQITGTTDEVNYTVGAFYFRERATDSRINFATISIPAATGTPVSINPIDLGATNTQSTESNAFAVYGQATYSPEAYPGLGITVGGRYTEDKKTAERTVDNGVAVAIPIRPDASRIARFDPALTIAYQASTDVNVYARYAQAFRSGGVSVRSGNFANASFDEEVNKQVEVGLKSDLFDRRLRLNVAAFYSWITGQQISVIPATDPTKQEIINSPQTTKIKGVEFESVLALVKGLTFTGSLGFLWGDQKPLPIAQCAGCFEQTQTYVPKVSAGVSADYTTPLGTIGDGFIHVDYKYTSNFHTSPTGLTIDGTNDFSVGNRKPHPFSRINVWNARVGLEKIDFGPVKANLAVFVDNIFDNQDITFDVNVNFQTHQPPRRWGVTGSLDF